MTTKVHIMVPINDDIKVLEQLIEQARQDHDTDRYEALVKDHAHMVQLRGLDLNYIEIPTGVN